MLIKNIIKKIITTLKKEKTVEDKRKILETNKKVVKIFDEVMDEWIKSLPMLKNGKVYHKGNVIDF